ncbi:MAG: hypothetical protein ABIQ89_03395 [Candidatus Saccharimonadales bacterium]
MNQSLVVLGRQPALGLAELESLYGADSLRPVSAQIAVLDRDHTDINFSRLGGSIKLAKVLTHINVTAWPQVVRYIAKNLSDYIQDMPEGKIRLGLNVYDFRIDVREINRTGLELKKAIKKAGRSVRVVPNTGLELNSAQSMHNQLAGPTGLELIIVKDGNTTILAQVTDSQDINTYAARDQARPKRDARVGMLPPKLAQIIVNLAGESKTRLLDPFCGTGVILQEATLDGYNAYGTDLEPRMIDYTKANLEWLNEKWPSDRSFVVEAGDATNHLWKEPFDVVAGETYLGRPFTTEPARDILEQTIREVDTIHRKFLKNLAKQTQYGFTMCLAIPAWMTKNGFKHLPTLDSLEDLGYTRISFVHTRSEDLIYHREGQFVGRELVVLTRK